MSIKKLFVGLAVVAMLVGVTASAQTADLNALLAQIAQLQAQIAALSGGATAGASTTFTQNLTVGSKGAEVTGLQQMLVAGGYLTMPAGVAYGNFGPLTKAAVMKWQQANGVTPASGYWGPISRGVANAMTPASTATGTCPAGQFNPLTGQPCGATTTLPAGCMAGYAYSVTTGQPCTATTVPATSMNGTDGTVILSYNSFAPASQTLKKGDTNKPVIGFKLQATNGPVVINHVDVDFNSRPWLLFSKITLKDSAGAVLGTKTLSGAADATEVTVGSDYKVRVDGLNYTVNPGTDAIIHADVDVLAASDKITGQTVTVGIASDAVRTINGKGYTATVGLSSGTGAFAGTPNSLIMSSSGSVGDIFSAISPTSSPNKKIVVTNSSTSTLTPDVVLGVFRLKSQNSNATINSLSFNFNTDSGGADAAHLFQNVRLFGPNGAIYGLSGSIATTSTASANIFTNMTLPLVQDTWTDLTLKADVLGGVTGTASTTLRGTATYIVGTDANYNTVTAASAANVTAADINFTTSGVIVTPSTPVKSGCGAAYSQGPTDRCSMQFTFTVQNVGNSDIYISKTPSIALSTTTLVSGTATAVSSSTLSTIGIAAGVGDTTASYDVPSQGTRTFVYDGILGKSGTAQTTFKVTAVKFGTVATDGAADATLNAQTATASSNTATVINYGLDSMYVSI